MYNLLKNLNQIVINTPEVVRQEAYGLSEEMDIKYLWEYKDTLVPQSLPNLFQKVSHELLRE